MCCRLERKCDTVFSHTWSCMLTHVCFQFASTRRLPSRLFSSTRRLFGSGTASPAPPHPPTSSVSPVIAATRSGSHSSISSISAGGHPPPSQQRRLAEFATILGDLKLAVSVWEALKKDGKGGSVGYTYVCGKHKGTQVSHFEGNASAGPFFIFRGNHPCHACTLRNHIPRCRSISYGPITCGYLCRTLGGQCRFSSKPP
jgi:hypothetical protein